MARCTGPLPWPRTMVITYLHDEVFWNSHKLKGGVFPASFSHRRQNRQAVRNQLDRIGRPVGPSHDVVGSVFPRPILVIRGLGVFCTRVLEASCELLRAACSTRCKHHMSPLITHLIHGPLDGPSSRRQKCLHTGVFLLPEPAAPRCAQPVTDPLAAVSQAR